MFANILGVLSRFSEFSIGDSRSVDSENGFELYRYYKADGSLDYDNYKETQIMGNRRKIDKIWAAEENIEYLSNYIKTTIQGAEFGLCHGTRRGREQEWFQKYLDAAVIGTEISPTAIQFPNTIEWDFHDVKPEWIDNVDFIYSNSLDHSYNPEKCLNAWMSCIRKGGVCVLEHTSGHESATRLDPFGAHIAVMPYLILRWGNGRYFVREILDAPTKSDALAYVSFIVIQRF